MHLLKHKAPKDTPAVPIVSHWKVPFTKKMRGRKFNARGEYIGPCGPRKPIPDARARENLVRETERAAKLPPPVESEGFDLARYRPLAGRVLCRRPPPITEVDGVTLPEKEWRSESWFWVVAVGPGVECCTPGDRVVFGRKSKPRAIKLGGAFHLGRATAVVALVEG